MINHIHLIARCPDMAGFICSFKTHTSKALCRTTGALDIFVSAYTLLDRD
jgi:hypothetical protein